MSKKQSRRRTPRNVASKGALARAARSVIESLESRQMLSVPNGPYGLALTWVADSQVSLHWRLNSTDETGLRVQRRLASGGSYQTVANLAHGWTDFTDLGLARATTYVYRVCAVNSSGASAFTNEYGV